MPKGFHRSVYAASGLKKTPVRAGAHTASRDEQDLAGVRAAVHDFRAARYATGAAPPLLPVPVDHVTSCAPQWGTPQALTIHRLSVAWWTKGWKG